MQKMDEETIYECMAKLAIKEMAHSCDKCPLRNIDCDAYYGNEESFLGVPCEIKLYKYFYFSAQSELSGKHSSLL